MSGTRAPLHERVLSARELNRAMLARQLLLERTTLPIPRVLERVGGLQDQYAPSGYIGLWTRIEGFRRDALTRAIEGRRVVVGTLMRTTIHLVSARDYWPFAEGVRKARRSWWLRVQRHQVAGLDMEAAAGRLRTHLAEGPRWQSELLDRLLAEGFPSIAWSGAGLWLDMVRVPPSSTWERRKADFYGLAEEWLGLSGVTEAQGMEHLVRRYLGAFGPSNLGDIASWAGVPITTLRPVIGWLRLRRYRDERGGELFDVPGAPLPDPETPAPIRFLPIWDATLLAHARRSQILPERYRALVFNSKTPQSIPTFLVDGAVAGSWRYEKGGIRVEPFEKLPRAVRRELDEEAERLAAFHRD